MNNEQEYQLRKVFEEISKMPPEERKVFLDGIAAVKSLSLEDLANISGRQVFAACGPCSPCGPGGEIGIEPGW